MILALLSPTSATCVYCYWGHTRWDNWQQAKKQSKKYQNILHPNSWRGLLQWSCANQWLVYFLKSWLRLKILNSVLDRCIQKANKTTEPSRPVLLDSCCWNPAACTVHAERTYSNAFTGLEIVMKGGIFKHTVTGFFELHVNSLIT